MRVEKLAGDSTGAGSRSQLAAGCLGCLPRGAGKRSVPTRNPERFLLVAGRRCGREGRRRGVRFPSACATPSSRRTGRYSLVAAVRELGFGLTDAQAVEIARGKDFIRLKNDPFDLDLVFAPDGIERFSDAWARRSMPSSGSCRQLLDDAGKMGSLEAGNASSFSEGWRRPSPPARVPAP